MMYIKKHRKLFVFLTVLLVALTTAVFAATVYKPSRTSTVGSHALLRGASPAFQNYVVDRPVIYHQIMGGAQFTATGLVGLGAGTPSYAEINTSEISGFTLDADNESVSVLIPIPIDIDVAKDVDMRVLWSNSEAAATGTARWYHVYGALTAGTSAMAVAATAMDTDGAAQADLAANVIQWSPWSTITGGTLTGTPGNDLLVIKTYVDVTTIADATMYGIQIRYYRKWLGGDNL